MKEIYNLKTGEFLEIEHTEKELQEMEKQNAETQRINEINSLRNWFNTEYREQNEKATRLQALGIEYTHYDELRNKTYNSLTDLYNEAEIVRARINELEEE